ncbi:MAG TPA: glutathione S-transferase [Povalibacter sp.]|nr:glutathione S-transferase [Povalibacter sp.]
MSEYRLYCVGESGNCYKVALMLELCGCDWEPVSVDYFGGETRGAAYRDSINEMGEVPMLEGKGTRLTQSGAILTWLAQQTGRFGGRNEAERLEILRWMLFDNHKFTSYYATLRWMVGLAKQGDPAVVQFLKTRAVGAFQIVDKHLAKTPFLLGDEPTIADFSLIGYHYYTEETGIDRNEFPHLVAWIRRIAELPGWKHPYELMSRGMKA